jgi:anti-anti-sigma factor
VRVELSGELDLASTKLLHARLEQVESDNPELLVLDLRRLAFMDSSGLREVLEDVLELTHVEEKLATVEDPATVGFPDEADRA